MIASPPVRAVLAPAALSFALLACRDPTQITFSMSTDVGCAHVTGLALAAGTSSDFDGRPVSTATSTCTGQGELGSIVTVPLDAKDAAMGFKAILGVGRDPTDCATNFGTGCVVARRVLNYIPHTRLALDVPLNTSCLGVACLPTETCVDGACTTNVVSNPGACTSFCGETALPPPTGKANVPSPAVCGDMRGLQAAAPWPMQGYCPTRLGRSPRAGAQTNAVRWTATIGSAIQGGASVAADGTVYVVANDGKLHAVSRTGAVLWASTTGGGFGQTVGAIGNDGTVYAGNSDGNLYAFVGGGGVKWAYAITGSVWPSPTITGAGNVLVGGGTGQHGAFELDPAGALVWSVATGGDVDSAPAIGPDGTIYIGSTDSSLYAVNPDGSLKWSYPGAEALHTPVVGPNGVVYVSGKPSMCAIDAKGKLLWITPTAQDATTPALAADGTVYTGDASGAFYAMDGATGHVKWQVALTPFDPANQPIVGADGLIYAGATDGTLYAISPDGTVKWKLAAGSEIHGPVAMGADGTIYAGTADGRLIAVGP